MDEMNKQKKYAEPVFEVIIQDESNKVFFSASGDPAATGSGQRAAITYFQDI